MANRSTATTNTGSDGLGENERNRFSISDIHIPISTSHMACVTLLPRYLVRFVKRTVATACFHLAPYVFVECLGVHVAPGLRFKGFGLANGSIQLAIPFSIMSAQSPSLRTGAAASVA